METKTDKQLYDAPVIIYVELSADTSVLTLSGGDSELHNGGFLDE